jgi:hypothetical protein
MVTAWLIHVLSLLPPKYFWTDCASKPDPTTATSWAKYAKLID